VRFVISRKNWLSMGCGIVTGGGPGLMQAANEGVSLAGPEASKGSMGIRVDLPFEQDVNPFVSEVFQHRTFFSRLHHFVLLSEAFVVVPGGIGTVLELAMIWQLLQVRKLHRTPLILIGRMWADFIGWGRQHLLRPDLALASREDLDIPHCVDTAQEAVSIIRPRYEEWLRGPA
jgi:predicted Rossmann-fold nucleotide-binding protein